MTAPVDVTADGRFVPWLDEHFETAERHGDNVLVVIGSSADPTLQLW